MTSLFSRFGIVSATACSEAVGDSTVDSLDDAIRYVNVVTQTVGVYPYERKTHLRDRLAAAGAHRLCRLGTANAHALGSPHDAMYRLQRLVHWMADDDIASTSS